MVPAPAGTPQLTEPAHPPNRHSAHPLTVILSEAKNLKRSREIHVPTGKNSRFFTAFRMTVGASWREPRQPPNPAHSPNCHSAHPLTVIPHTPLTVILSEAKNLKRSREIHVPTGKNSRFFTAFRMTVGAGRKTLLPVHKPLDNPTQYPYHITPCRGSSGGRARH